MSAERRVIKFIDVSIDRALTVLFLILLLIGVYFIADSWWVFNASALGRLPGYTPQSPAEILQFSEEAIAWITVDDTKISYPVMQGVDNSEYLNKNAQGDYSLSGAIFLDSANNPEFTDYYSALYGHHMAGGFMFGAIDYFADEEYFDKHRKGTLLVVNGKKYEVNIFAFVETDASESLIFDVTESGDRMGFIARNAKIYRPPEGDLLLALTTCKSPLTTERTCLFATTKFIEDVGEGKPLSPEELMMQGTGAGLKEDSRHPFVKIVDNTIKTIKKMVVNIYPKEKKDTKDNSAGNKENAN